MQNGNEKLAVLVDTNISELALQFAEAIGADMLADEARNTKFPFWNSIVGWFAMAPDPIGAHLRSSNDGEQMAFSFDEDLMARYVKGEDVNQLNFEAAVGEIDVCRLEGFIQENPEWFNAAAPKVKKVIELLASYSPENALAPICLKDVYNSILGEAIEYAGYAGLFD